MSIEERVWKNKIPLSFKLSVTENINTIPIEYFALASRNSYLPLVADKAIESLRKEAVFVGKFKPWFTSFDYILDVTVPIGPLFDIICVLFEMKSIMPLEIIIHFTSSPKDVISIQHEEQVEKIYFAALKQSLYLYQKSTSMIRDLSIIYQQNLWSSVKEGDFEMYSKVLNKMLESGETYAKDNFLSSSTIFCPIRIIKHNNDTKRLELSQPVVKFDKVITIKDLGLTFKKLLCCGLDLTSELDLEITLIVNNFRSADLFVYFVIV